MPDSLAAYWAAWNGHDLDAVPELVARAVSVDVEWNDPRDSFVGRAGLEAAIRRLRSSKPEYQFFIASELDHHHGRYRYRWDMLRKGRVLMEGLDIVAIDSETHLITRIDGFFGYPTPIAAEGPSGVPEALRQRKGSDAQ